MEEIRLLRPNEFQDAAKLADFVFRDSEHKSMGVAYPQAFSPALRQSYGAFVNGTIVSFIGFVPSVVRIGEAELNVYSIGSVCTHPDHRGKGYAGAILERIREHSRQAGAPVILVSGSRGIYERFGCRTFGETTSFIIDGDAMDKLLEAPAVKSVKLRPLAHTDWFALKRLAAARAVRYEQSLWDLAELIAAEPLASNSKLSHRVWVAERDGEAAAFAVIAVAAGAAAKPGRAALTEWAGDAVLAAALAAHGAKEAGEKQFRAVVPWYETEFASVWAQAASSSATGKLNGTVAVVDPLMLLNQLAPYLKRKADSAFDKLSFRAAERNEVVVQWEGGGSHSLSMESFISLLFDRNRAADLFTDNDAALLVSSLFPIPFPSPAGLNYV